MKTKEVTTGPDAGNMGERSVITRGVPESQEITTPKEYGHSNDRDAGTRGPTTR